MAEMRTIYNSARQSADSPSRWACFLLSNNKRSYEKPYKNPVQQIAYDGFAAIGEREVTGRVTVPHEQLEALFAMTPYYWKTPRGGAERLAALSQLETDISFRFLVFEKL